MKEKENVILLGARGTGKTHLAQAVGLATICSGARVRFTTAVTLAQELLLAQENIAVPLPQGLAGGGSGHRR